MNNVKELVANNNNIATLSDPTNPNGEISISFQWVTPQLASKMLEKNHHNNRPLKDRLVRTYAKTMAQGLWVASAEPIKISEKGELIDGQHRLKAVADSGKGIHMLIMSGLPSSALVCLDNGQTRSLADAFAVNGGRLHHPLYMGAAVTVLSTLHKSVTANLSYETAQRLTSRNNSHLIDFHSKLKDFNTVCEKFFANFPISKINKTMSPSVALALNYLFHDEDPDLMTKMFTTFETNQSFEEGNGGASLAISRELRHMRRLTQRITQAQQIQMFLWAYETEKTGLNVNSTPHRYNWTLGQTDNAVTRPIRKKLMAL